MDTLARIEGMVTTINGDLRGTPGSDRPGLIARVARLEEFEVDRQRSGHSKHEHRITMLESKMATLEAAHAQERVVAEREKHEQRVSTLELSDERRTRFLWVGIGGAVAAAAKIIADLLIH